MPKFQLTKAQKVLRQKEFQYTLKCGVRQETTHFIVFLSANHQSTNRLGMILSRKTGKAVLRNRIKRVVREYFRQFNAEDARGSSFHDLVLIGKKNLHPKIGVKEVCKEIKTVYEKNSYIFDHAVSMDDSRAIA